MPKTKLQSVIFTAIMVFFMVFCMTVYTVALGAGGLTYMTFAIAIKEMWIEYVIVYILALFVVSPLALKLAFRFINPKEDNTFNSVHDRLPYGSNNHTHRYIYSQRF
jgi:hypothetical protein